MAKKKKRPAGGRAAGNKGGSSSSPLMIGIFAASVILVAIAGVALGLFITRGGNDSGSGSAKSPDNVDSQNGGGDSGSGGVKLPAYVYSQGVPEGTAEAYQFAVANQDVLKYIPCYCGCGELDGHDSNLDCFIKSGSGDNIVFDKHAAG